MMTCVWCGKTGKKIFYARVRWDELDSKWYRCGTCGSLMILPRPSKRQIAKVYEDGYRNKRLQPHAGVDNRLRYAKTYRPTVFAEYELSLIDLGIKKRAYSRYLTSVVPTAFFLSFVKTTLIRI